MKAEDQRVLDLPTPEPPAKKGRGGLFLFLTALILCATGAFWFTRTPEVRTNIIETSREAFRKSVESSSVEPLLESLRQHVVPEIYSFAGDVSEVVSEVVSSVMSEAVSAFNSFSHPPPPPRPSVHVLPSQPGTLSGHDIQAPIGQPAEYVPGPGQPDVAPGTVAPKVKEDSVVRPIFVKDMAQWLVSRYKPGKGGSGSVSIGVQAANMRYGVGMHGLASGSDSVGARGSLLRYAFNAPMLDALYHLYVDHFMEALGEAAAEPKSGPALTSEQTGEMYRLYSAQFASVAATMNGIAAVPDLQKRLQELDVLSHKSVEAHRVLNEAVFELDEARQSGDKTKEKTARMRMDGSNARYRKSLADHEAAQNVLLQTIKKGTYGNALDDGSILFLTFWLDRRLEKQEGASAALAKAGALLNDLSLRLSRAAGVSQ